MVRARDSACHAWELGVELADAAAFGDGEPSETTWLEAIGGPQGLLSGLGGVLGLLVSALKTCFQFRQKAEAYGSAASNLGLLEGKVESASREAGNQAIGDEVWADLEKELSGVLQGLGASQYSISETDKKKATKLEPPDNPPCLETVEANDK